MDELVVIGLVFTFAVTLYRVWVYLNNQSAKHARQIMVDAVRQGWTMRFFATSAQGDFDQWTLHNKNGVVEMDIFTDRGSKLEDAWAEFIRLLASNREARILYHSKIQDPDSQRRPATLIGSKHSKW